MEDYGDADMRAYAQMPDMLFKRGQAMQDQPVHQLQPPPEPREESSADFGGIDVNAQLLEAILQELRTISQTIQRMT
jgi:hypothetical protein